MAVKRYDGSAWQTVAGLGAQGAAATSSSIATWVKTASGGETSLSGNDDNSQALSYTIGQELVFINGTLLKRGSDYTATNGTSITGLTALAANDVATVWTVNAFSVTGAIANTIVDAKGDLLVGTAADTPGRLAVGTNDYVLTADSTTGTGLKWAAPAAASMRGCSLYRGSGQTISDNTATILTFDNEYFDTDAFHDNSTNTSRITIPAGLGGKYLITGLVYLPDNNTTGNRILRIFKNGTGGTRLVNNHSPGNAVAQYIQAQIVVSLIATDYVELQALQTSGGNLIYYPTDTGFGHFTAVYLGA